MDQENTVGQQLVISRLQKQRKLWRMDHPFGFIAKPQQNLDGSINLFKWNCLIPGPHNSPWQYGKYFLTLDFKNDYPIKPPKCVFKPVIPHPNVYPSGTVCLSILNEQEDWKPHLSVKQILIGIQNLLRDQPNIDSPAQLQPFSLYKIDKLMYIQKVKKYALCCKNISTCDF